MKYLYEKTCLRYAQILFIIHPTKNKRTTTIFPLRSPFSTKCYCHEIFISDQSLLKLECNVDEYLYFPCVGTKHIKAKGKGILEALIQRYRLHVILNMFYISKV